MKKINILYFEPSTCYGGSANSLANIIRNLNRENFNSVIVIKNYGPQLKRIINAEIIKLRTYKEPTSKNIISILVFILLGIVPEVFRLICIIYGKKIDVVHINTNITSSIPAIIAAKLTGLPCICHIRETRNLIKREVIFAKLVNKFIILNSDALKIYKKYIPEKKMTIIYHGLDIDEFNNINPGILRKEYALDSMPIIETVGRIVKGKGQKEFVLAAKEVLKIKHLARFIVVGDSTTEDDKYYQNVRELVSENGLNENIIFTGWRDDIKNVLADSDVFVFTSTTYNEGLPNTIIEAMALSKVVVSTNIAGPSDIVVDNETGFLVQPEDILAMAKKIIYLLDNPHIAKKMGEAGRKRVEELFDIKKTVKNIEAIYTSVLQNG